jgi:hypothetical protein
MTLLKNIVRHWQKYSLSMKNGMDKETYDR